MKLSSIQLYFYLSLLFAGQALSAGAQTDTLNAHLQSGTSASMMNTVQVLPEDGMVQPLSAGPPVISYGGARTFGVNEQVDWSPTNSGDAATFSVTVEQTLASGYYNPLNTVSGADGSLYIANTGYHSIFKRTSAGVQTVFAGGNSTSYGYVNGTGTAARFRHPSFVAVDASGNIFVSDQQNHRIRKITPSGVVTVFAGSGSIGSANGTGTAASFQYPMGLAFDGAGNLYVADAYNHRIRKITPAGVVSTYAGSGTAGLQNGALLTARFNYPMGLSFDSNGDLYVADRTNHAVRRISSGQVTTIAGNGTAGNVDGQGSMARINNANNLVVDNGSIYLVDMMNNSLRYISPSGYVTTISTGGQFTNPFGISRTPDGKYHITENTSNRIKKVNIQAAYSISPALPSGLTFDRSTGKISGKLSAVTASQSYTVTARNTSGTATSILTFSVGGSSGGTNFGSSDQNYILETVPRRAYKSIEATSGKPVDSVNMSIQYFDGLGRLIQTVQWQASPTEKDIIQHIEYDGFGRESKKYLPYAASTLHTGNNDISYKAAAKTHQIAYYATTGSWDAHVKKMEQPYAETVFENSPLNRVLEQGAPGQIWQPSADRGAVTAASSTGHTVAMEYGTNVASDVRLWTVNANNLGASGTPYYATGKLYRTVTKDENWVTANGKGGTVEEYKDFEDRVVLKRVWKSNTEALNTYYVYDDFGDLRYVIPPGYTTTTVTDNNTDFNEKVYAYRYDGRRRLIEKKIPGKGWEHIVYNRNDQPVLTQDALQRGKTTKEWLYTKYDAFGRVTESGIFRSNLLRGALQDILNGEQVSSTTAFWDSRAYNATSYDNRSYPRDPLAKTVLQVNYYDDYGFKTSGVLAAAAGLDSTNLVKGLQTGSLVYRDNGTLPLLSVNYYDKRGRLIQSAGENQFTGGTDYVTNTYSFPGELLTSTRVHRPSASGTATTIVTTNSYDHVGRLKETRKKVNTQTEIVQSQLVYNEIGQLKQKNLHVNGATNQQEIYYTYNERGWTTRINDPNVLTDKRRFAMQLNYANNPQAYNGNIGSIVWNTKVTTGQTQTPLQSYIYTYDPLNRLKKAAYSATGKNNFFNEELAYDNMGNIDTLRRSSGSAGWYNHFKYSYTGNRLNGVADAGTAARSNTFTYDANGNAVTNSRLGITDIEYNSLNLPRKFTKGAETLTYSYDATGRKLSKQHSTGTTQYADGIQYRNGALEFIQTEEGRILPNGSSFIYEYFLKDHLGNTRAIIDHTGAVKQIQDYYAFGMEMNTGAGLNSAVNQYKYNGKEKQTEMGLDQLDYGARFYDAEIGRWNVPDPLTEDYYSYSPYNYVGNNPIKRIDPNGEDWWDIVKGAVNAVVDNASHGTVNKRTTTPYNSASDYNLGQDIGDIASTIIGGGLTLDGGKNIAGGTAVTVGSGGTVAIVGGAAVVVGSAEVAEGVAMIRNGITNFSSQKGRVSESKYSDLKEPKNVGNGKPTTPAQRKRILEQNKANNGGTLKSDGDGRTLNPPSKNVKGQKADMNQAEVDHLKPKSKGGSNSNSNMRVISKEENLKKGNRN